MQYRCTEFVSLIVTCSFISVDPLTIDEQPQDSNIVLRSSAQFSVVASGEALTYQWLHNGEPLIDIDRIQGSTTANLFISDVSVADVGDYQVRVSTSTQFVDSDVVSLQICEF